MEPLRQDKLSGAYNTKRGHSLVLYDDDYHTFDYVVEALVGACSHDILQATQCTYLVHFKKQCVIKEGTLTDLKPIKNALIRKRLKVEIQ